MSRLVWGAVGERFYEVGVDRGVLYVDDVGYAWSGLVSVNETPSGGEARPYYLDGTKYLNFSGREEYEASLSAYYSPREFDACDGIGQVQGGVFAAQQRRKSFGLSYRTKLGNDVNGSDHAYKIHILYNALVAPTDRGYVTLKDNPDVPLLVWQITTKPEIVPGTAPSSHLIIDSSLVSPSSLVLLEDILYGDDTNEPRLPYPEEISNIFAGSGPFTVTDLGNDEFEITGILSAVMPLDENTYQITSDTVIDLGDDEFEISSEV